MTLAGALFEYEGALRASMQAVYQLRLLPGGRTEPSRTLREVSDYVAHLPQGCALWVETGGPLALTNEATLLGELIYLAEVADWRATEGKGRRPERMKPPRPAAELRAEAREHGDRITDKARKHAARQQRQAATT